MRHAKLCLLLALVLRSPLVVATPVGSFQEIAGSPFAAGSLPASMAYSPITPLAGNLFAAVPNFGDATVSVYEVDKTSGVFTQVANSPFATGNAPAWAAFSPLVSVSPSVTNLFAAIVNQNDNTVSVYTVDQTSGAFSPVTGSPFATGSSPFTVAFSPLDLATDNLFAAVPNSDGGNVSVYQVNKATGLFTEVTGSPFASGSGPLSGPYTVAFSPHVSGNLFAAVTNFVDNTVSVFSVNQASGAFTLIATYSTGAGPYGVAYTPVLGSKIICRCCE